MTGEYLQQLSDGPELPPLNIEGGIKKTFIAGRCLSLLGRCCLDLLLHQHKLQEQHMWSVEAQHASLDDKIMLCPSTTPAVRGLTLCCGGCRLDKSHAYILVTTSKYPNGALRGELMKSS